MKTFNKLICLTFTLLLSNHLYAKNELIIFSLPNISNPYDVQLAKVAEQSAKTLDLKLQILDGQNSSAKQSADLENAIIRGAKGMVIDPNDVNAIASAVEDVKQQNIPIVTVDRQVDANKTVPHFGANNYKGGLEIAKIVVQRFPQGANIILLTGQLGSSPSIERSKGIKDGLRKTGKPYHFIVEQSGNWLRSEGLRIIESVMPTLKTNVDVIISANDDMALGAVEALKNLNYQPNQIVITGFDAVPEVLNEIKTGWIYATADQQPRYVVKSALIQLANKIRKNIPITGLDFAPLIITKTNLQKAERINETK